MQRAVLQFTQRQKRKIILWDPVPPGLIFGNHWLQLLQGVSLAPGKALGLVGSEPSTCRYGPAEMLRKSEWYNRNGKVGGGGYLKSVPSAVVPFCMRKMLLSLLEVVTLKHHEPCLVWLTGAKHFQPLKKDRFLEVLLHAGYFNCQTCSWIPPCRTTAGSACASGWCLGLSLHRGSGKRADSVIFPLGSTAKPVLGSQHSPRTPQHWHWHPCTPALLSLGLWSVLTLHHGVA